MKKVKKLLSLVTLALAGVIISPLVSCRNNTSSISTFDENSINYEIKVSNLANVGLSATVELLKDGKAFVTQSTDEKGKVNIKTLPGIYEIRVTNLPMGYYLDNVYKTDLSGSSINIICSSKVIDADIPRTKIYQVGDIIYDFSVTTSNNSNYSLSEVLKTKKMVMINFWATWCTYCVAEFPYMNEAYELYKEDLSIIALSTYDTNSEIANFKFQNGLTFDMAFNTDLFTHFSSGGLPTSVIIDRYGMICEIYTGGKDNTQDFVDWFEKYTAEDYKPDEGLNGSGENNNGEDEKEPERVKPNISQPASSELEAVANGEGFDGTYSPEDNPNDAEYSWPWIVSEDGKSIQPSNKGIDNSFAMVYTTITLNADEAFVFDYKSSSESGGDYLYVIIDGDIVLAISGVSSDWETCYAFVGLETAEYEVCFCFIKDSSLESGDDTVYIKNLRYMSANKISEPTYIKRQASYGYTEGESSYTNYVSPIYNEDDGYYHVGETNGPLLLCDFFDSTHFSNYSLYETALEKGAVINKVDYLPILQEYANYASNNSMRLTPITNELKNALEKVLPLYSGVNSHDKEWLEVCTYYSAYGTNGVELESPIKGLSFFDPLMAYEGNNKVSYDTPILPRGKLSLFIPEKTGVYQIKSTGDIETNGWVFVKNPLTGERVEYASVDHAYRDHFIKEDPNVLMYAYLQANQEYYIDIAYFDIYAVGTITFNIKYMSETYDKLETCSPGYFTTTQDSSGNMTDIIISTGINVVLGSDGYYHELRTDDTIGSIVYVDFSLPTSIFDYSLKELISKGAFDFSVSKTGEKVDENGLPITGKNLTLEISSYLESMIDNGELEGMIPVDARLAELLQMLMDKYTFKGVKNSWLKLCYYYHHYDAVDVA